MLPDVALFTVVMGALVAGTRLALARPPHWFFMPRDQDVPSGPGWAAITSAISVVAVAIPAEVFSAPLPAPRWGMPYVTLTAIAVLTVLFARSAARSWPARAAVAAVSVTAGSAWALAASWLTYSLAAAFTAVAVITIVRPRLSFWLAAAAMTVLAGFDFIQVSLTHATVHAAAVGDPFADVAAQRGHSVGVPGLIGIPGHAALLSPYAAALGIGDVTLPGMLIVIAGRAC